MEQSELDAIKERCEKRYYCPSDLPACLAEIKRLRALVTDMQAIHANLRRDYAEQTADARRMSTKLDRIGEIMDE